MSPRINLPENDFFIVPPFFSPDVFHFVLWRRIEVKQRVYQALKLDSFYLSKTLTPVIQDHFATHVLHLMQI